MKNYLILLLASLSLWGCANGNTLDEQNNVDSANQVNKVEGEKIPAPSIVNHFAQKAAIGGKMEVESSTQMIESTENPDVQTLAVIMVKEHGMANTELDSVARNMQLIIPKDLPTEKKAILKKMEPMDENERNKFYAALMVKEHKEAIALFEQASRNEKGKLKEFAAKYLPALKHHLREAEHVLHLQNAISGDKGDLPLKISKSNEH